MNDRFYQNLSLYNVNTYKVQFWENCFQCWRLWSKQPCWKLCSQGLSFIRYKKHMKKSFPIIWVGTINFYVLHAYYSFFNARYKAMTQSKTRQGKNFSYLTKKIRHLNSQGINVIEDESFFQNKMSTSCVISSRWISNIKTFPILFWCTHPIVGACATAGDRKK